MQPAPTADEIKAFNLINKIIYGALLFSVAAYWLVLQLVIVPQAEPAATDFDTLRKFLPWVAGVDALLALYFRFARLGPLLSEVGGDSRRRMNHLRFFYILCWVLSESVALFGFSIPFFTANLEDAATYFIASIALFLLCYPSPSKPLPAFAHPEQISLCFLCALCGALGFDFLTF